jgi:hypothetical protein
MTPTRPAWVTSCAACFHPGLDAYVLLTGVSISMPAMAYLFKSGRQRRP